MTGSKQPTKNDRKEEEEPICEDCNNEITPREHEENEGLCDMCLWCLKH